MDQKGINKPRYELDPMAVQGFAESCVQVAGEPSARDDGAAVVWITVRRRRCCNNVLHAQAAVEAHPQADHLA